MSFVPTLDVAADQTGERSVPHLRELRGIVGHFPDGLGAFDQMYERMVGKGRLDPALRMIIIGASARWRSDGYVSQAMFDLAIGQGVEAEALQSLIDEAEGPEPSSPEAVLLAFCRKITGAAYKTVQRDVDTLTEHGWTTGEVVEAVTMVSLSGYMSVMSAAGGLLRERAEEPA